MYVRNFGSGKMFHEVTQCSTVSVIYRMDFKRNFAFLRRAVGESVARAGGQFAMLETLIR